MRSKLLIGVLLLAGAGAFLWLRTNREAVAGTGLLLSGTVEATEAQLGFQRSGRLARVSAREGDWVEPGGELASLDQTELRAQREQATAQVAAARALLAELERGSRREEVSQARAGRDAARQRFMDAERDKSRTQRLFDGGAVSLEAMDKSTVALEVAQSHLTQAEEQLGLLVAGPRRERIEAQRAQLAQAQAAVETLDAALDNMAIVAPFRGLVTRRQREPGEIVGPGSAVLTILDLEDRWVRVYVPEDRLGAVAIGQPAEVVSDTYPDRRYPGEVTFIASEAEFTPKTVQTQQERVRLVYAVKVRVLDDPGYELKPGMPVDVILSTALPIAAHSPGTERG